MCDNATAIAYVTEKGAQSLMNVIWLPPEYGIFACNVNLMFLQYTYQVYTMLWLIGNQEILMMPVSGCYPMRHLNLFVILGMSLLWIYLHHMKISNSTITYHGSLTHKRFILMHFPLDGLIFMLTIFLLLAWCGECYRRCQKNPPRQS